MITLVSNKTTPEALRLLRIVAATNGEKQYQVLERLLRAEHKRLQAQEVEK